ncbi:hypothetical protein HMPREF2772_00365 [Achromobacter xylosoxidans]|uniref:hypothetical protein n=1 Tax=Alcaligenes xylosoxydans xylosoxydans TaxID=85698 RepID=UPI0008A4F52B|nr:hypothetical protein [Achromobacter xylosoxidans]OFL45867.1 hypothetical protein HMPREF2772_00365 [Achromobacter xylosoxidans]
MIKFMFVLASSIFSMLGVFLAGSAMIKGDGGLGAVALAILALVFKLEAELPEIKDILRQQRN